MKYVYTVSYSELIKNYVDKETLAFVSNISKIIKFSSTEYLNI